MLVPRGLLLAELAVLGSAFARTELGPAEVARIATTAGEITGFDNRAPLFPLLPAWDDSQARHYLWSTRAALIAGAAERAYTSGGDLLPHAVHEGDYVVGAYEQRIVCASLEIRGRLILEDGARLVVVGDLFTTDSVELGPHGEHDGHLAQVACGGDVHIEQLLSTGGWYVIAGTLYASVVCAYYNQGALIVAGDLQARVLYERDHYPSIACGQVNTEAAIVDTILDRDHDQEVERMLELVRPELVQPLRDAIASDDFEAVETHLQWHALARTLFRRARV